MSPLYIFAFIIHSVFSKTPCKDGVEIVSTEIKNPEDLLGNWTFVYHWDPTIIFLQEFLDKDQLVCSLQIHFEAITPELVKAKEAECAKDKMPFNWADAKLKMDAPRLDFKDSIIIIGEKDTWIVKDCMKKDRFVFKKVTDDYVSIYNLYNFEFDLIAREPPTLDELKCVAHNVNGQGMSSIGICYK